MTSFKATSSKHPVITVVREPGQLGSFGVHIGLAVQRAACRVLMIDLTSDGLMSKVLMPYDSAPGALTASQIFAGSIDGHAVELLFPGLSLVRSARGPVDQTMTVIDAAARLRHALAVLVDSVDVCVIEVSDDVSAASLAAMKISTNLFTTVCDVISTPAQMQRHVEIVADLASAAVTEESSRPPLLTMRLPHPITRDLEDREMKAIAERTVCAVIAEFKSKVAACV